MAITAKRTNSPEGLVIRLAQSKDAAQLVEVHYQTWLETYPRLVKGVTVNMVHNRFKNEEGGIKGRQDRWQETISKSEPNKKVYVADLAGKVVGFILPVIQVDGRHYVASLYVLPGIQGHGVGSRLMEQALRWLEADKQLVALEVVETNKPAISFYERFGFRFSKKLPIEPKGSIIMSSIEMIRQPAPL